MVSNELLVKSGIVSLIVLGLDFLFHLWFTTPQETMWYFIIKFFIAFYIAYYLMKNYSLTTKYKLYASVIFATIFSAYYRFYEFFAQTGYLSRVPSIKLGTMLFTTNEILKLALIWGIVHGGIFYLSLYLVSKYYHRLFK